MNDSRLVTVHVAYWGGVSEYVIVDLSEPRAAVDRLKETIQSEHWRDGFSVPVASYYVTEDELDELTLRGPQLMVRGQPHRMVDLTIIRS